MRTRFNLVHGLDPFVLHKRIYQSTLTKPEEFKLIEHQAHLFAAAFLLPAETSDKTIATCMLSNDDQTILIILDLANIDLDDFIEKGQAAEGRTVRSFDRRSASKYLTNQFANLWRQKEVEFDIDIDGPTLNIFTEDKAIGMPVRLHRRSTGFRWYVSFVWKFTHATNGEFKNYVLRLMKRKASPIGSISGPRTARQRRQCMPVSRLDKAGMQLCSSTATRQVTRQG